METPPTTTTTSQQPFELPVTHPPTRRQCRPFTIRLISHNPLTVMTVRVLSCLSSAGIKAESCDSPNKGNTSLIPGQALLTPVTPVTAGQKVHFVFREDQRTAAFQGVRRSDLDTGASVKPRDSQARVIHRTHLTEADVTLSGDNEARGAPSRTPPFVAASLPNCICSKCHVNV